MENITERYHHPDIREDEKHFNPKAFAVTDH
jgi:hypothetical protein